MRRSFFIAALLAFACHGSSSPTAPDCRPVMGALGNAQISGYVLSGAGSPIANAHVRFAAGRDGYVYGGRTDAKGFYYVGDMWTDTYTYTVTLAGQDQPAKTDRVTLGCGANTMTIVLPVP